MSKLKKVRSGKFTQISNIVFEDSRLSYKEIGRYCNMMKFPDDWEFSVRYLAECHQDKKAAVKTGIDKLLEYGYISRDGSQNRDEKGYFGTYDYVIYEDPFDCVDVGFGNDKPVDVVIRPEDVELVAPEKGIVTGEVTSLIFKGVHYEMDVDVHGVEWLVHSTRAIQPGTKVGVWVDPFNIQIMNKPESEDEMMIPAEDM